MGAIGSIAFAFNTVILPELQVGLYLNVHCMLMHSHTIYGINNSYKKSFILLCNHTSVFS